MNTLAEKRRKIVCTPPCRVGPREAIEQDWPSAAERSYSFVERLNLDFRNICRHWAAGQHAVQTRAVFSPTGSSDVSHFRLASRKFALATLPCVH